MKNERKIAEMMDENDNINTQSRFHFPDLSKEAMEGSRTIYLCGNSLGLQPMSTRDLICQHLDKWSEQGVEGHFEEPTPWLTIDDVVVESMARLVGANKNEVVIMNSLTANLHFMMASFYRPTTTKNRILMEGKAFPSDIHAVTSQIQHHRLIPSDCLLEIYPEPGEVILDDDRILTMIREHGDSIALVLLSGVQYYTGQYFDMKRITEVAHEYGCMVGFDLAHAVGNISLELHRWGCDFACWCTYKYMNSGPGSIGGCFVHENHGHVADPRPRLSGWWGHRLDDRFLMDRTFIPCEGAYGYRVSNPSPLLIACVRASLDIFDEVGMHPLREKSIQLTGYLESLLIDEVPAITIFTPSDPQRRGCQLSLSCDADLDQLMMHLKRHGIICDSRKPNVIRIAPCPLYNTFVDVYDFVDVLKKYFHN